MKTKIKLTGLLILQAFLMIDNIVYSQSVEKTNSDVRAIQVSFLPFLSYNSNSPVIFSLNILGGTVEEVRGVELGGVINIDRKNVGKCQLAGVANLVGGTSEGLQLAGVINTAGNLKGVAAAGVLNFAAKNGGKCQLAGVGNITGDSVKGFQSAGVFNISEDIHGFQLAGVLNSTGNAHGLQVAGIMNDSREVQGVQVSGLINRTSALKGLMLGVINIADSCNGLPIGVLSFVKENGYHKLEVSADEVFFTNLAFRTGIPAFYTIISAGIRPDNFSSPLWSYGFGIGTKFRAQDILSYDLELTSQHVSKGRYSNFASELEKIYFGIDRKLGSSRSVAIGLTFNLLITDTDSHYYNEKIGSFVPYRLTDNTYHRNGINISTWLGGKIAFRF